MVNVGAYTIHWSYGIGSFTDIFFAKITSSLSPKNPGVWRTILPRIWGWHWKPQPSSRKSGCLCWRGDLDVDHIPKTLFLQVMKCKVYIPGASKNTRWLLVLEQTNTNKQTKQNKTKQNKTNKHTQKLTSSNNVKKEIQPSFRANYINFLNLNCSVICSGDSLTFHHHLGTSAEFDSSWRLQTALRPCDRLPSHPIPA